MCARNEKPRSGAQFRGVASGNIRNGQAHYIQRKPLPPCAVAVEWKRAAGRQTPAASVLLFVGSLALDAAAEQVDREKRLSRRYRIEPIPLACLPPNASPDRFNWSFVQGLAVAVIQCGQPERDTVLLRLVQLLLEAGALIVSALLSGGRLGIFKPDTATGEA